MTMPTRRVVVTGVGAANAFGVGRQALVAGLASGEAALEELEGPFAQLPPGAGGKLNLPRKEYRNFFDPRVLRMSTMTRYTLLGCIACGDLLIDAGCPVDGEEHPMKGAFVGSYIVPPSFAKQIRTARVVTRRPDGEDTGFVLDDARLHEAMKMASAFDFLRALPNMPSSHLSIQTGYQGPGCTYLASDSSGLQAMIAAVQAIELGQADAMVAGGAGDPFQEVHLAWQQLRGMWAAPGEIERRIRPYAKGRSGTLPAEGAAMLYFEEREHALARGAKILGEVVGTAHRFLARGEPDQVGVRADALRAALPGGAPDWIGPSALGHVELDALEAQAYAQAFGDNLGLMAAVALTEQVGYTGPAHGCGNLIAALLSASGEATPLRKQIDADPDTAPLAAAFGRTAKTGGGAIAMGSNFSIDGVHAALAIRLG